MLKMLYVNKYKKKQRSTIKWCMHIYVPVCKVYKQRKLELFV